MTGLVHIGAPYQGQEDLLRQTVPFVRDGLAHHEPILVAQPQPQLEQMTKTFAGGYRESRSSTWPKPATIRDGSCPGCCMPSRCAIPGGPCGSSASRYGPGRSAVAYPACVPHEALINLALREVDATVLCPYDSLGLPAEMLSDDHSTVLRLWVGPA